MAETENEPEGDSAPLIKPTANYEKGSRLKAGPMSTADHSSAYERYRVTGGCLCKVSVVGYLLVCVAVSVLYVGTYRHQQELDVEDKPLPWIPGTVMELVSCDCPLIICIACIIVMTVPIVCQPPVFQPEVPKPVLKFSDRPYTEWRATRWTYHDQPFADWPTLPASMTEVVQISHGSLGKTEGFWLLTDADLVFVRKLTSLSSEVEFLNVSQTLSLTVTKGSRVAADMAGMVYLVSPDNITLLDCSEEFEF